MQPRGSREAAERQPRDSRGTAEVQPRYRRDEPRRGCTTLHIRGALRLRRVLLAREAPMYRDTAEVCPDAPRLAEIRETGLRALCSARRCSRCSLRASGRRRGPPVGHVWHRRVMDVSLSHRPAGESTTLLHATVRSGARRSGSVLVRKLATFGGISKAQDQPTAMCSPSKAQQQHVSNMRPPTT